MAHVNGVCFNALTFVHQCFQSHTPTCPQVDLGEVYQGAERGAHRYRLSSMVCYYGQHYQALVLVPDAGGWLMFDDMHVSRVGSWADVRRKCEAGRIQPSVLFYEAAGPAAAPA